MGITEDRKGDLYCTKTTCFGSKKGIKSGGKGDLFCTKTTCFAIMKVYEGKIFTFINVIICVSSRYGENKDKP